MTFVSRRPEPDLMKRRFAPRAISRYPSTWSRIAWWNANPAEYHVGRRVLMCSKIAATSTVGAQMTPPPAARGGVSEVRRPCPWNIGITCRQRSVDPSA